MGGMRASSFFKAMVLDFEERVRIPPGFTKNLSGKIGEKFLLKTRAGEYWRVDLERGHDVLFFGNGWAEFVKENSLEEGDFVHFLYRGCSRLDVIIFGGNGCEKLGNSREKQNSISPNKQKHQPQGREEDHIQVIGGCCCKDILQAQTKPLHLAVPSSDVEPVGENEMLFESKFCPLKLKYPHFKRTLLRHSMTIPGPFVRKYGLQSKEFELFEANWGKKAWRLIVGYEQSGRARFHGGWLHFQEAHDIRTGDTCVFELIGRNALKVHIIRATTA